MSHVKIPQIQYAYQPMSTNISKPPSRSAIKVDPRSKFQNHQSPPLVQTSHLQLNLQSSNHSSREKLSSPYGIEDKHPKDMIENFEHFRQLLSKNLQAPKAETHLAGNRNVHGGFVTFMSSNPNQKEPLTYSIKNPNRSPQHL
mmetsp:Transcript_2060/g.3091  ORF Transcript_2060/g.3091 Transcript_2060/m.3091 type:complete len:143 (-) Transcript_2060:479-907(-)